MKMILLLVLFVAACGVEMRAADDTVTILRSRLEALERKEAELKQLKQSIGQTAQPIAAKEAAPKFPGIATLPALKHGDAVEAGMLVAHFREDSVAASKRYAGTIRVSGVVAGFEKPSVMRNYKIILRAPGSDLPVICDFNTPESYSIVSTDNRGAALVGTMKDETRVTISRVGLPVVIEGECRGLSRGSIKLANCRLE